MPVPDTVTKSKPVKTELELVESNWDRTEDEQVVPLDQNRPGTGTGSHKYARNMTNMQKICRKYVENMPNMQEICKKICRKYAENMQENMQNMQNMQEICQKYASNMTNKK